MSALSDPLNALFIVEDEDESEDLDAELATLTAANDPDWDPAEHPRSKADGKFIPKGAGLGVAGTPTSATAPTPASGGKLSSGISLKITTTIIYKTKYDDGAVIAVRPQGSPEGLDERVVWHGVPKKFALQRNVPNHGWVNVKTYTKGDAYKKFSQDTNWEYPAKPAALAPATASPPPPPPPPPPSVVAQSVVPKIGKPLSVNTVVIYKTSYADGAVLAVKPETGERLRWSATHQKFFFQQLQPAGHWLTTGAYGKGEAYKKFSKDDGWFTPDTPVQPLGKTTPSPLSPPPSSPGAPPVAPAAQGVVGKTVVPNLSNMTSAQLNVWYTNLTQDEYDGLTNADQSYVEEHAEGESLWGNDVPKTALTALTEGTGPEAVGPTYAVSDDVTGPGFTADDIIWSDDNVTINGATAYGIKLPATPGQKLDYTVVGYLVSGEGTAIDIYDLDHKLVQDYEGTDLTSIKSEIVELVNENGKLQGEKTTPSVPTPDVTSDDVGDLEAQPTAPVVAVAPVVPNVMPSDKAQLSAYVHSKMKTVGDVGTPNTTYDGPHTVLTQATAASLQATMLKSAGGKKWTPQELAAVQRYTTSVGYQTTNAVLRNDEKRMNMFSVSQLQDGVRNAVDLQSAMTPTVFTGVRVFRGTGAQAFGAKQTKMSLAALKKFEGKVITDEGFVSTTILEKTSAGYDYTKKPIRMEIDVPPGTPALYVTSATPSWSKENELILGAGTSFKIIEVREATAADKAKHGAGVEQIVRAQVVPSPDAGQAPAPGATPSTPAVVPSSSVAPKPEAATPGKTSWLNAGSAIKINTGVIYKTQYAHGAVVAVKPNADPAQTKRLVWSGQLKKFILQSYYPSHGIWANDSEDTFLFSKKDAYNKFSKETGWQMPPFGLNAYAASASTAPSPPKVAPGSTNISSPPPKVTTPNVVTPPPSTATKTPKFTVTELITMYGELPDVVGKPGVKTILYNNFKYEQGKMMTSKASPAEVFQALHGAVGHADKQLIKLNLLQMVRLVDEVATPVGGVNQHIYENKIIDWLKTADGASHAAKILVAGQPTVTSGLDVDPDGVNELRAKISSPASIGTPKTGLTSADFVQLPGAAAAASMQTKMHPNSKLTSTQRIALEGYTGSNYVEINGVLRRLRFMHQPNVQAEWLRRAALMQETMRPLTRSIVVHRGTVTEQLGLGKNATLNDVRKLVGSTITDDGFVSTSVLSSSAFSNSVRLTIEAPEGTPARYVAGLSHHSGERELILAAGTKFEVLEVWQLSDSYQINVRLRVVP